MMTAIQLRAELFREMNPMLEDEAMLAKMLVFVRSLFVAENVEKEKPAKKSYQVREVDPEIEKWSGCISYSADEIANDPRLKSILSR